MLELHQSCRICLGISVRCSNDPWAPYVKAAAASAPPVDPWAPYIKAASPQPVVTFDDLVPPQVSAAKAPLTFDDLIPAQQKGIAATMDQVEGGGEPTAGIGDVGRRIDDTVRLAANGATLGYADKVAGMVLGSGAAQQRELSRQAQERAGPMGTAATIAGSLLPASQVAKGVGLAAGAAEGVPGLGALFGNPLTQGAATGAVVGGADAAGHDTSIPAGAALGAAAGLGGQALGSAASGTASRIGSMFNPAPAVMTGPQLKAAAQAAYANSEDAGLILSPQGTSNLATSIRGTMADFGYHPAMQPGGAAVLDTLGSMDGQNVTLKGLDMLRQITGRMRDGSPSEAALGSRIVNQIDGFANNLQPSDVLTGDAQGGIDALNSARSLWQRSTKDQDITDAIANARLKAGSTNSGGNINNATRQDLRGVLQGRQDWTPDEESALVNLITGSRAGNALRQVGKLSPEGSSLNSILSMGAAYADPRTLALPAIGFAAKRASDAMTARGVNNLGNLVRAGGDASAMMPPPNMLQRASSGIDDQVMRAILGSQMDRRQAAAR